MQAMTIWRDCGVFLGERAAGVERFVYVSYSRQLDDEGPLTQAKRAVERCLIESGMTYVILLVRRRNGRERDDRAWAVLRP